jgi:hypothetical protein
MVSIYVGREMLEAKCHYRYSCEMGAVKLIGWQRGAQRAWSNKKKTTKTKKKSNETHSAKVPLMM